MEWKAGVCRVQMHTSDLSSRGKKEEGLCHGTRFVVRLKSPSSTLASLISRQKRRGHSFNWIGETELLTASISHSLAWVLRSRLISGIVNGNVAKLLHSRTNTSSCCILSANFGGFEDRAQVPVHPVYVGAENRDTHRVR